MTTPEIATQRARVCLRDGFPLLLDLETARRSVEAGWPAVELWTCMMGHSVRGDAPSLQTGPRPTRPAPLCPACGAIVSRAKGSSRKMCSNRCSRFVAGQRSRAYQHGEAFVLEAMPWYRGAVTAYQQPKPLPPLDPLAGRMPRDWAAGWLAVHGGTGPEAAA
jgi:hypothetical protein